MTMNILLILTGLLFIVSMYVVYSSEYYIGNTTIYQLPAINETTDYVCQSGGPIGVNMCNYA